VKNQLIDAVIMHAADHYEVGGWDILVECWEDEDIWKVIEGATSEKEAIRLAAEALKPLSDYRDDIVNA
jgi:hypothetical protein